MAEIKEGLLLAVGDFPEGSATASRLRMIAKALVQGGLPVTVALLHADSKKHVSANTEVEGCVDGVRYLYLNKRTVRPTGLFQVVEDTARGIIGAVRLLLPGRKEIGFLLLYTPTLVKHGLPVLAAIVRQIPVIVEICEIRSKATGGSRRRNFGKYLDSFDLIMEWLIP